MAGVKLALDRANADGTQAHPLSFLEFQRMPRDKQYEVLLGRSVGSAKADDTIDAYFKRFLKKAWRTRRHLTNAVNKVTGRTDLDWISAAA